MIVMKTTVPDQDWLQIYSDWFANAPDVLTGLVATRMQSFAPDILDDMQQEPGPVETPIMWTSAKQRRWVKMQQAKGAIPFPYVRTHTISKGWKVTVNRPGPSQARLTLSNSVPGSEFVEGIHQQQFHQTTGWLDAETKASEWGAEILDELWGAVTEAYLAVGKSNGG